MYSLENSYNSFLPEKVHTKFCKFVIGANKYSCNIACKGEKGRFPLAISGILLSLKYWLHINDSNISNFDQRFTYQKKVREKSRECHNHKPQPFPDPRGRGNRQIQTSTNRTNVRKALRLALSSPSDNDNDDNNFDNDAKCLLIMNKLSVFF